MLAGNRAPAGALEDSLLFILLASKMGGVLYLGGNNRSFHKEPFSFDHSVVCLSEQVCAWKPGSEGLVGFE